MSNETEMNLEANFAKFVQGNKNNFERMAQMTKILGADVRSQLQAASEGENQEHRRAYVRSVFAFMEAVIFNMKQVAGWIGGHMNSLEITDLVLLTDQSLNIRENGAVKIGYSRTPFLNSLRFAFRVFPKSMHSDFAPNCEKDGWESLKKAVEVRDRLTHPKKVEDLTVTDQELALTMKAFNWFFLNHALCSHYTQKAINEKGYGAKFEDLDKTIAELEKSIADQNL